MHTRAVSPGRPASLSLLGLALLLTGASSLTAQQTTQHYTETPLTSNLASLAPNRDANLVNPWGLSRSSNGPWWVSDNGSGVSTLYDGTGKVIPLVVPIPPSDPSGKTGAPTGTVFNGDPTLFPVAAGKGAIFLFVTEDGTISGWNPGVSPSAVIVVNHKDRSVYKGLAIATANYKGTRGTFLYAADFRQGRIEVFDFAFKPVTLREQGGDKEEREEHETVAFSDEQLGEGYAPFNVQNIGGNLYVAFAKQDTARFNEVDGAGLGYVDVFSPTGKLLQRLQRGTWFNAPWGLAQAPGDFGVYSHDILVGQFGSGRIEVFDPVTGRHKGVLEGANNRALVIDGLWGIAFGNGAGAGPANSLYFVAGINQEQNGLFGSISPVENVLGNDQ